jgi:hypothetical protein
MSGQFQRRKLAVLAEYRDPHGSVADSKLLAHELSCAKAAIWQSIKPLAITNVLWQNVGGVRISPASCKCLQEWDTWNRYEKATT